MDPQRLDQGDIDQRGVCVDKLKSEDFEHEPLMPRFARFVVLLPQEIVLDVGHKSCRAKLVYHT